MFKLSQRELVTGCAGVFVGATVVGVASRLWLVVLLLIVAADADPIASSLSTSSMVDDIGADMSAFAFLEIGRLRSFRTMCA
jgi:hypothetical protein